MEAPHDLVRRFALELGKRGIERTDVTLTPEMCGTVPLGTVVTCLAAQRDIWILDRLENAAECSNEPPESR